MCSIDLNMGTISSTVHIKTIFNFLSGMSKDFIGNTLCSSDNSVMQHIHILHFFTIDSVPNKPLEEKNPEESNLETEEAREWVLSSCPVTRKFLSRKARTRQEK